jgi:hypothetical protein
MRRRRNCWWKRKRVNVEGKERICTKVMRRRKCREEEKA